MLGPPSIRSFSTLGDVRRIEKFRHGFPAAVLSVLVAFRELSQQGDTGEWIDVGSDVIGRNGLDINSVVILPDPLLSRSCLPENKLVVY